jgi:hypothetical protein
LEAGWGYGFEAGWGNGFDAGSGKGVGAGAGNVVGLEVTVGNGDGLEIDATLAQRVAESLMCIALAGPQPRGVDATSTTPMTATVRTVTDAAARMRWNRDPSIISLLVYPYAGPC